MAEKTGISWTDATWNPVRGCSRVSEGCRNCYAEAQAARIVRMAKGKPSTYDGLVSVRSQVSGLRYEDVKAAGSYDQPRWTGEVRLVPEQLAWPLTKRKPLRVFVNSMSDLFHESLTNEQIAAVFGVMAAAPQHTFQVLTKRAQRMREWFETPGIIDMVEKFRHIAAAGRIDEYFAPERVIDIGEWPGYAVTSKGRVLSTRKGDERELKPQASDAGHLRVQLYHPSGLNARVLVHRLVLDVFDRMPRDDEQGCHIDGDPTNNALWNLRWGSQSDNWNDSKRHGTRRRYSKLTDEQVAELRRLAAVGEWTGAELGRRFGISDTQARNIASGRQWAPEERLPWPLPSVWLGVSVEDQDAADERIPELLQTPAAIRFLSCEPLLGKVDIDRDGLLWRSCSMCKGSMSVPVEGGGKACPQCFDHQGIEMTGIDWVIAGCESGPGARPCEAFWLRRLRDDCKTHGVAFFLKQATELVTTRAAYPSKYAHRIESRDVVAGDGSKRKPGGVIELPYLDGVQHAAFPVSTNHKESSNAV